MPVRSALALLTALVLTVAGCSSHPAPQAAPTTPAPTTTTATPSPTPTRPPARPKPARMTHNPLTGLLGVPKGPVIGVKIDNTAAAHPQVGLEYADVVYVEQVEGGLTRLVAVFASHRPRRVEPVRSVRGSDPELLSAYGRMALAFSGGAGNELASLHRSPLLDASPDTKGFAYRRDGGRAAPYNLFVDLQRLAAGLRGAAGVRDVGFRWGPDPRFRRGKRVSRLSAVIGSTPVSFLWDGPHHRFVLTSGGGIVRAASGAPLGAPNVIIQFCPVTPDYRDIDQAGSPAAYTHSIGSGKAVLFRDGHGLSAKWVRPRRGAPTRFVDKAGHDLLLHPGGVWVLLVRTGGPWAYR